MIHAIKASRSLKAQFKLNEDALTASVFERLMYLPKELIQHIFSQALSHYNIPDLDLHQIESIEFWPHWSPKETPNVYFVEPDVFISTKLKHIIIEAKRYDENQQSKDQWQKQITAYNNEFDPRDKKKELIFIALGGLSNKELEELIIKGEPYLIYKCHWRWILRSVLSLKDEIGRSKIHINSNWSISNVLEDIILIFRLFGYSTAPWFDNFMKPVGFDSKILSNLNFEPLCKK